MRSLVAISAFSKKLYIKSHPHQSDESVFKRRFLLLRAIPGQSACVGISYVLSGLVRSGALEEKLKEFKKLLQTNKMYNTNTIKSLDPSIAYRKVRRHETPRPVSNNKTRMHPLYITQTISFPEEPRKRSEEHTSE